MTSIVTYLGNLRTSATHVRSEKEIITDAPTDNQGRGAAFSPTDLVATALASCLITIMGIKARDMKIDLEGTRAEVTKIMGAAPRRIVAVNIVVIIPHAFDEKTKSILEKAALNCPVAHSLNKELTQHIRFNWAS